MTDQIKLDSKDYSEQTLHSAIHGENPHLKPQLAVVLLKAKLGAAAEEHLASIASNEALDVRTRLAAIKELADFDGAKPVLKTLSQSRNELIAQSASQVLQDRE